MNISLAVVQIEEDGPLPRGNDERDLVLEPGLVARRELGAPSDRVNGGDRNAAGGAREGGR
jgi:hypothetical protein